MDKPNTLGNFQLHIDQIIILTQLGDGEEIQFPFFVVTCPIESLSLPGTDLPGEERMAKTLHFIGHMSNPERS